MTQQTIAKPLPCPFCGGEKVSIHEGSTYRWAHAACGECGAAAGDIRRQYGQGVDDPEVIADAIAAWNTRTPTKDDKEAAWRAKLRADFAASRATALMLKNYLGGLIGDAEASRVYREAVEKADADEAAQPKWA